MDSSLIQGSSAPKTSAGNTTYFWKYVLFPTRQPQRIVHGTRLRYCVAVLQTSLFQTCGHASNSQDLNPTMPSGQSEACVSDQSP